jgi:hypothetical protein
MEYDVFIFVFELVLQLMISITTSLGGDTLMIY